MLNETFIYKGKRAQSMGIELRESLILSDAIPKVETITVPGRNGDIQIWDGSYENRTITAKCYLLKHAIERDINSINSWLIADPGYFRFEDTKDPKRFMMARASGGINKQLRASVMSSFDLLFDVDPRRFLKSGERKINLWGTIGAPFKVFNPTSYPASPLLEITVERNATYTFGMGGGKLYLRIEDGDPGVIYYDTENDRAYNVRGNEINELVASEGSLKLLPGENEIFVSSTKSGTLNLIPRWWEI